MTAARSPSAIDNGAVIRSALDGCDHVAKEMEKYWGVGRLRLLVSDFYRLKFDAQTEKLNAAIASGNVEHVRVQAEGMKRAWEFLDKEARAAGHRSLDPNVWEVKLPRSGIVVALVRSEAEAHAVSKDRVVFTITEIAEVIDGLPDIIQRVKTLFPGALIKHIKPKKEFSWSRGDDLPF